MLSIPKRSLGALELASVSMLLVSAVVLGSAHAGAHAFHTTTLEAEYLPATRELEVALRVDVTDLEVALTRREGRAMLVGQGQATNREIANWLGDVIVVQAHGQPRYRPVFVGKQFEREGVWLFFTVHVPTGLRGVRIANHAFFDVEPAQLNHVEVIEGREIIFSRLFTKEQAEPVWIAR